MMPISGKGIFKASGFDSLGLEYEEPIMTWHPQGQRSARGMWLTSKLPTQKHKSRYNQYKMELGAKNMCGQATAR